MLILKIRPAHLARAAGLTLSTLVLGCSAENWDWFGMNKKESKETKPAARAQNPAPETSAAKTEPKSTDDAKAKEVDARVEQYVRSMDNRYDPSYVSNDFTTKIERQNDPERADRIRKTAARSRSDSNGYEPEWAPDSREPVPVRDEKTSQANDGAPQIAELNEPTEEDDSASSKKIVSEPPPSKAGPKPEPIASSATPEPDAAKTSPVATNRPSTKVTEPTTPEETGSASDAKQDLAEGKPIGKPPVLSDIGVSAAPKTTANAAPRTTADTRQSEPEPIAVATREPEPSPSEPAAPVVTTPAVDPIKAKIAELERLVARDPNNLEEQFRLRMMYLVAGQDDKALAPTDGVNEDIQEIMRGQIQALMSARSTSERDPATWANRQLEAIETLRTLVRDKADLQVPKVELCSAIEGFGRYEPISPPDFRVGARNLVLLYIEVDNFQCEKTPSGMYRTLLSVRQSLLSKSGEELWTQRDENIEDLARQRRSDFYLTIGPLAIPKSLGPGEYVMKVEVEDVIAGKMNSNVAKFKMVP